MKKLNYEQPSLTLIAFDVTDILLASGELEEEKIGLLDSLFDNALGSTTWDEIN